MTSARLRIAFLLVAASGCGARHNIGTVTVTFQLTATTDLPDVVHLAWTPPAAPAPTGYLLRRDGAELARLPAAAQSFDDTTAAPGSVSAPTAVTATEGTRTDAVALSWAAAITTPGATHAYQVVALAGETEGASSNRAPGARAAPQIVRYQLTRDGGATWLDAGVGTAFADTGAPLRTLTAPAEATPRYPGNYVRVRVTGEPAATPPRLSTYQVRADTAQGSGPASAPVSGYRGVGSVISYQWQRSAGDADGGYADLPGVTGAIWFDDTAPFEVGRYYRAVMRADGAEGVTPGERTVFLKLKSVSAGLRHACGVLSNDRVVCWGENAAGQAPAGPSKEKFKSVSAGDDYTCGIRTDDWVDCWGNWNLPVLTPPGLDLGVPVGTTTFKSVSLAPLQWKVDVFPNDGPARCHHQYRACGLQTDGKILCWGGTDGCPPASEPPTDVFKSVAVGWSFSCGILEDARVVCWGLGDPSATVPLPPADAFKSVSVAGMHACGIRGDDRIVCWGHNSYGEAPATPTAETFNSVITGESHTCGLRSDGEIVCWGAKERLPDIPRGSYKSLGVSDLHTCAVRSDDKVFCWGGINEGGAEWIDQTSSTFKIVSTGGVNSCGNSAGPRCGAHTCGIRSDDRLVCWGGDLRAPSSPAAWKSVSVGKYYACGVRADGQSECWGATNHVAPGPNGPMKSVGAGPNYAFGVDPSDRVRGLGATSGWPFWTDDAFNSVSVGWSHACALRLDGRAMCVHWSAYGVPSDDFYGEAPPGPSADTFSDLSAGQFHTCGVRSDGKVICWGANGDGQAPPGPSAYTFKSVSAGSQATCGVRSDDRVVCWGRNDYGQAPPGPSPDRFRSVSQGGWHACGIRSDGRLLCWGVGYDL